MRALSPPEGGLLTLATAQTRFEGHIAALMTEGARVELALGSTGETLAVLEEALAQALPTVVKEATAALDSAPNAAHATTVIRSIARGHGARVAREYLRLQRGPLS